MKPTGMIRRIDDLGRIVIPKNIRERCSIKYGEPFEFFITADGDILLKRIKEKGNDKMEVLVTYVVTKEIEIPKEKLEEILKNENIFA